MRTEGRETAAAPLVVVAMSGGVDSSVAAGLLVEAGYRVMGASLRLWDSRRRDPARACSDSRDAGAVARHLAIPHTVIDRREDFDRRVVMPFVRTYAAGRTPNPCAACNSDFKLGALLDWALAQGASFLATGHYARVARNVGSSRLLRGRDASRDQSYFLFQLTAPQLERAMFPLGDLAKDDVRKHARRLSLPVADKAESQDLCFGEVASFVASRGLAGGPGEIVRDDGVVLGAHSGVECFTIGQRRGLGVSGDRPLYVERIEADTRRVIVSDRPPRSRGVVARDWTWVGLPVASTESLVFQVRYRHTGVPGRLEGIGGNRMRVRFDEPAFAVAPGQAVVAYRGPEVVGGGWIEKPL
jgi:tRNA-specific 2-thiouridylase